MPKEERKKGTHFENSEKQGKAEVSRAILFLKHGSRSY